MKNDLVSKLMKPVLSGIALLGLTAAVHGDVTAKWHVYDSNGKEVSGDLIPNKNYTAKLHAFQNTDDGIGATYRVAWNSDFEGAELQSSDSPRLLPRGMYDLDFFSQTNNVLNPTMNQEGARFLTSDSDGVENYDGILWVNTFTPKKGATNVTLNLDSFNAYGIRKDGKFGNQPVNVNPLNLNVLPPYDFGTLRAEAAETGDVYLVFDGMRGVDAKVRRSRDLANWSEPIGMIQIGGYSNGVQTNFGNGRYVIADEVGNSDKPKVGYFRAEYNFKN